MLSAFEQLAERYKGNLDPLGTINLPVVTFGHLNQQIIVQASRRGKNPDTSLRVWWPDPHFRCLISCGGFDDIWIGLGAKGLQAGSETLRRHFRIRGRDVAAIQRFLTPGFESSLQHLRLLGGIGEVVVSIRGGVFEVRVGQWFRDAQLLYNFVELALDLYSLGTSGLPDGIELLEEKAPTSRDTICQICGDSLPADAIRCRKCQTPHHRDCWEYNRGCSTYGCGEKRFTYSPKSVMKKV